MSRRASTRPPARRDIEEQSEWLGRRSLPASVRFLDNVSGTIDALLRSPSMGHPCPAVSPALQGLRAWPVRGFKDILILYRPDAKGIEVVRVLHGARDLPGELDPDPDARDGE